MGKRVGLFISGSDKDKKLLAGTSDISKVYSVLTDEDYGECCRNLSRMEKNVNTQFDFYKLLMDMLNELKPSDQFIFYFSGHGDYKNSNYGLLFGNDFFPFENIVNFIESTGIKSAIIILDSCFSGHAAKSASTIHFKNKFPRGIAVLTSSMENEFSYENDENTFSVFTELFCECIKTGNGNTSTQDNYIYPSDIKKYVIENNKHIDKKQMPEYKIYNEKEEIWIAKNITIKNNEDLESKKNNLNELDKINSLNDNVKYLEKVNREITVDDLDWNLVTDFLEENELDIDLSLDKKEILRDANFIRDGYIINAVILSFAKKPSRFIHSSSIIATVDNKRINRKVFKGPNIKLMELCRDYILNETSYSTQSNWIRDDEQFKIPSDVIREAISNALTHRCFEKSEKQVRVNISKEDSQLEVISPGDFVGDYEEMFKNKNYRYSNTKSARMSEYMMAFGITEGIGQGFDYFRKYRNEEGKDSVKIYSGDGFTKLVIKFRKEIISQSGNSNIVFSDKIQNHYFSQDSKEDKLKKLLTHIPRNDILIGREDDLVFIQKSLEENKSLLLFNGIGGIGKTSLVKEYANRYIKEYDHIAFIEFNGDIKDSLIKALKGHFQLDGETPEELFQNLQIELLNMEGKNLLIVDDINSQDDFNILRNISSNFELLITSRTEFKTVFKYKVETLSKDSAKELFNTFYNVDENIDKLLEYIGYHTLFIILTAQALANNDTLSIEILEDKFKNGEFGNISNLNDEFEEIKFDKYLQELFIANNLKDEEILVLKRLSLFPSIDIEYNDLKEFLCIKKEEEHSFSIILNMLSRKGWLIKDKLTYKLHQITREFIIKEYKVSYEECEDIIKYFASLISEIFMKNPVDSFEIIPYVINFDKIIKDKNEGIATLYNKMSMVFRDMGEFGRALEYQTKGLELLEEILGEKHPDLATSYNNISMIFRDMGEFKRALEYQEKALVLGEEILGEKHPDLATSYNNISMIYENMGELERALEYQEKALILREEILGEKHPDLATSYNNISMIYQNMGELEKALAYQTKGLELSEEILGEKHPILATSYNNISMIYKDMEELDEALKYQKKALGLREEILGEKHPSLAISYANISQIYLKNRDIENSKIYIDKAVVIYKELFPNGHPDLDVMLNIQEYINKYI